MLERMRRVEPLLKPYGIRRWVERNPREIMDALYIVQEVSNRANANGLLTPSYFVMQCNQRPRKGGETRVWVAPLSESASCLRIVIVIISGLFSGLSVEQTIRAPIITYWHRRLSVPATYPMPGHRKLLACSMAGSPRLSVNWAKSKQVDRGGHPSSPKNPVF